MAVAKPSVPSAASGSQRRPSYRRRLGYHRRSQPIPSTSSTSMATSSATSTNTFTSNMAAYSVHAGSGSASRPFTDRPSSASDDGSLATEPSPQPLDLALTQPGSPAVLVPASVLAAVVSDVRTGPPIG